MKIVHISETDSTNRWLRQQGAGEMVVWADYQTAGRGCGSNRWESERGQNLTFSVLLHPQHVAARQQFRLSMAAALAVADVVGQYADNVSVKWPNDVYVGHRKICGMLIENRLQGTMVVDSIVGIGLNVNQQRFVSDAPNPVALAQLTGQTFDREQLLHDILERLAVRLADDHLPASYRAALYRRDGFHAYRDAQGNFTAAIDGVDGDGRLLLRLRNGEVRSYGFKEVSFIIEQSS